MQSGLRIRARESAQRRPRPRRPRVSQWGSPLAGR